MTRLRMNILTNFAGQAWSALIGIAFVPVYLRFMGIEAYGLIGFYMTLQGALRILDFGLSPTTNREMARYSVQPHKSDEARDFVRTVEIGYWAIGIAAGAVVMVASPWIAAHWIRASAIPIATVQQAVLSMGVLSVLQWPLSFYQGGLLGLQRQALLNGLKIASSTLSNGGAALVLWLVAPSITAFFAWQIAVSSLHVVLIAAFLWRSLPASNHKARIEPQLIRNIWRFAAGMTGLGLSGFILSQLDKVILSRLLSLAQFGHYALATVAANGLLVIIIPVFNAVFPHFSALVAQGDAVTLRAIYHRSSQLMAALISPIAALMMFFSPEILLVWTGDAEVVQKTAPIISLLALGTAFYGFMNVPYALQLAFGWTGLSLYINVVSIAGVVPAIFFMNTRYGLAGVASVWVCRNVLHMLAAVPLTHRRLLRGDAWRWFGGDTALPFLAAVTIAWLGRQLVTGPVSPLLATGVLCGTLIGALVASALAASQIRLWLASQLVRVKGLPSER